MFHLQAIEKGQGTIAGLSLEECGELITAVAQFKRGRTSHHDVMTELADVFIMVEQVATMMNYEDFEKELDRKLTRLRDEKLKLNGNNS